MKTSVNEEDNIVIESLNNCWLAMCREQKKNPTAVMQTAMNMLARVIDKTIAGCKKAEKSKEIEQKQVTIEEWIELLNQ